MRLLFLIIAFLFCFLATAEIIPNNTIQFGDGGTTSKYLIFDHGQGGSNSKLTFSPLSDLFNFNNNLSVTGSALITNEIVLGDGTDKDLKLLFSTTSNAYLKWDNAGQALVFSNDGMVESNIGSGGGGSSAMSYGEVYAGEDFDGSVKPISSFLKRERVLEVSVAKKWIDLDENGTGERSIEIPAGAYLTSDLGTGSPSYDLVQVIDDAFSSASPSLIGSWNWDYDSSTRTASFSVTGLSSLNIKIKTGAHGGDNLNTDIMNNLLGFANADITTFYAVAVSTIDDTISYETFAYKTDTNYIFSSEPGGLVIETASKLETISPYFAGINAGFSGLAVGKNYYTDDDPGELIVSGSPGITNNAKLFGVSPKDDSLAFSLVPKIINSPDDWLSVPELKDWGGEIINVTQCENSSGKAFRVMIQVASTYQYWAQYKNASGLPWQDSTWTFAAGGAPVENWGGAYYKVGNCVVTDDGQLVMHLGTPSGTQSRVFYSQGNFDTGVNTGNGGSALTNFDYSFSIDVRNSRALIHGVPSTETNTYFAYSDDTGSGYTTWTEITLNRNASVSYLTSAFIQYFPNETGVNKWRYVAFYTSSSATNFNELSCKGDGSNIVYSQLYAGSRLINATRDKSGTGNRINFEVGGISSATIYSSFTNEDYNSGTMVYNDGTAQDINLGGSILDATYNYSASHHINLSWNKNKRSVLIGNYYYTLIQTQANPSSKVAPMLFYSKNRTSNTFEAPINLSLNTAYNHQDSVLLYIPSKHGLVVVSKILPTATLANTFTNGQIWARYIQLAGDGAIESLYEWVQIDGGKSESGFAGLVLGSSSNDGISISWEEDGGSFDVVKSNRFY